MAIYEVETEDGVFEVEVEDDAPAQAPKNSILPGLEKTEEKIAGREDLLSQFMGRANLNTFMPNPPQNIADALQIMGGSAQRLEAMVSNAGLAAQRGEAGNILPEMMQGATGDRLGQLGDLVRTTEVGGPWNEALATSAGFLATLGLDKLMTGGKVTAAGKQVAKEGAEAIKNTGTQILSPIQQSVKDAVTKKTGFLDDVRSAFYDAKSDAVDQYGLGLEKLAEDNPDAAVTLRSVIDQLNTEIAYEPKLRNAINKVPYLANLLDNPKAANNLTLKEAQSIVNDLQSKLPHTKLRGVGVRADDIPLLDAIHDIKAQMVEAFPEIKELRKDYGKVLGDFNIIKNKIKKGSLQGSLENKFGDDELNEAAKRLLEKSPKILERLKNYNRIRTVGSIAKKVGVVGASGYGVYELLNG